MSEVIRLAKEIWEDLYNALQEKHPEYLPRYTQYYQQVALYQGGEPTTSQIIAATEIITAASAIGIYKPMPPRETISFKIPHHLKTHLLRITQDLNTTKSAIIIRSLEEGLGLEPPEWLDEMLSNFINIIPEEYIVKIIKATLVTDDNSNLEQRRETLTPENAKFERWLYVAPQPFAWGVALYRVRK